MTLILRLIQNTRFYSSQIDFVPHNMRVLQKKKKYYKNHKVLCFFGGQHSNLLSNNIKTISPSFIMSNILYEKNKKKMSENSPIG